MTVAPLIAMKSTKCESLEAVGKELDRRAHTYANDVDQSGRHIGYICRAGDESPVPLEQAIERRMGELSREMDEWSLLDEVGDMRGARRELDGREAPARALDNQVL